MACLRHARGFATKVADKVAKKAGRRQRDFDDFDLGWKSENGEAEFRIYLLSEFEAFDPMTSSHKGRHDMMGPAIIVCTLQGGGVSTQENHENDPRTWNWIGRCIREGHLNAKTITSPADEKGFEYKTPEVDDDENNG